MGRRGLVGLFTTHGAKVRGFESRLISSSFFNRRAHPSALSEMNLLFRRQKRIGRTIAMWNVKTRERDLLTEEEEPAGESGMDTRNDSVRFEHD